MPSPDIIILYVAEPSASAEFYTRLLGQRPVEATPTFVMFALPSGVMLGLWGRTSVLPTPEAGPGAGELAFTVESDSAVRDLHGQWRGWGMPVVQEPGTMDFGYTFTALDPDGHRLRVLAPSVPPALDTAAAEA